VGYGARICFALASNVDLESGEALILSSTHAQKARPSIVPPPATGHNRVAIPFRALSMRLALGNASFS